MEDPSALGSSMHEDHLAKRARLSASSGHIQTGQYFEGSGINNSGANPNANSGGGGGGGGGANNTSGEFESMSPTYEPLSPPESFAKFIQRRTVGWLGSLSIKNMNLGVQMLYLKGNISLTEAILPPQGGILNTSQRMRLEQTQMDKLAEKIRTEDFLIFYVKPASNASGEAETFRQHFVNYLIEKQAAGIVRSGKGIVYLFPPCPFSDAQVRSVAMDVNPSDNDLRDYLLAILLF